MSGFGLGAVFGMAAMLAVVFFAWLPDTKKGYQQIIRILESDRDAARTEAKVFRNLLFPIMAKAEGEKGVEAPKVAVKPAAPEPVLPKSVDDIWKLRIPYKDKFKLLLKFTNSKQVKTDALASALANQKQEKPHAV